MRNLLRIPARLGEPLTDRERSEMHLLLSVTPRLFGRGGLTIVRRVVGLRWGSEPVRWQLEMGSGVT